MKWTIAAARKNFAQLIRATGDEPQRIERYGELVGVMIGAQLFDEFEAFRAERRLNTLGSCLRDFRTLADCGQNAPSTEPPVRLELGE